MQNISLKKSFDTFSFDCLEKLNQFFKCNELTKHKAMKVLLDGVRDKYVSSDGRYFHNQRQLEEHLQLNPDVKGLVASILHEEC